MGDFIEEIRGSASGGMSHGSAYRVKSIISKNKYLNTNLDKIEANKILPNKYEYVGSTSTFATQKIITRMNILAFVFEVMISIYKNSLVIGCVLFGRNYIS